MATQDERRRMLRSGLALVAAGVMAPLRVGRAAPSYGATIAAMKEAHAVETRVSQQYFAFGRKASADGYKGVAYLFTAFASSEQVHATNFGKVLARLGVEATTPAAFAGPIGTTRENLIAAAKGEAESIEDMYPKMLERIRPEGHEEAMRFVDFAWASERQHHDKIRQIRRYSPTMFELVARHIDAKTGAYFVCQAAPKSYRRVEPPA